MITTPRFFSLPEAGGDACGRRRQPRAQQAAPGLAFVRCRRNDSPSPLVALWAGSNTGRRMYLPLSRFSGARQSPRERRSRGRHSVIAMMVRITPTADRDALWSGAARPHKRRVAEPSKESEASDVAHRYPRMGADTSYMLLRASMRVGPCDHYPTRHAGVSSDREANDKCLMDHASINNREVVMPANPRLTRAAEDSAAQLVRALRGTEYELMARQTQGYVRAQAGALRLIESFARDGMISGTVVAEYGDVLTVFGSPVARIEGDDAA